MSQPKNKLLQSWIPVDKESDFSIYNIPFGIASYNDYDPRPATRIGNTVIDLSVLADFGFFDDLDIGDLSVFYQPFLNDFIALGKPVTGKVRERLMELFIEDNNDLRFNQDACELALQPAENVEMLMPVMVPNYTDFYASEQHAYNVGVMFRDPKNALLPNWKHIPVGYHGRASSIVVSGASIHRPYGQTKSDDRENPVFGPSRQMDFELEMGFVIGKPTSLGDTIPVTRSEEYIFGLVLFNDLSARDIQKWEYVPLGPFLGKNFGSVISPWIITLEALHPFRVPGPVQSPPVLPYLQQPGNSHFDVKLEVWIEIPKAVGEREGVNLEKTFSKHIAASNLKYLYWSFAQMLAHHTVNGCNVETGDIYASGTISGPEPSAYGSMLELAWKGTKPLDMPDGSTRKFLEDNDTVVFKAYTEKDEMRIGFGECRVKILPAK